MAKYRVELIIASHAGLASPTFLSSDRNAYIFYADRCRILVREKFSAQHTGLRN